MILISGSRDKGLNIFNNKLHYGFIILAAGVLTTFGSIGLGRFAMGMIIRVMGEDLRLSHAALGLIVSSNFFGYLLSTFISGALASKYGPRIIIAFSMAAVAAGMVLAGIATGFWIALIAQLLIGIGAGGSNVPATGLIARWFSEKVRGSASGAMTIGSGLGFALSGILVPYLLKLNSAGGWRTSWFVLATAVAAFAVIGASVFRNSPREVGLEPVGGAESGVKTEANKLNWRDVYRSKALWELGSVYFMFGFSYVVFTTFFAAYLVEQLGFTDSAAGKVWFFVGFVSIASGFIWGWVSDKRGRRDTLLLIYSLQGIFLLLLAINQTPVIVVSVSIVYAMTLWSIPSVMAATCADYVGGHLAPAAFGMVTLFFGLGQVLSPWISGYLSDITHSYALSFMVSGGASLIGAFLAMALPKRVQ